MNCICVDGFESTVPKKIVTFTHITLCVQKSSKNFKPSIHNVVSTTTNFAKIWLFKYLLVVVGSQGIVVRCTAAIFLRMVDCACLSR